MRIERVIQIKNRPSFGYLKYGYSIQGMNGENTKYFERDKRPRVTGGWSKESWLQICSNFRLEFIYD